MENILLEVMYFQVFTVKIIYLEIRIHDKLHLKRKKNISIKCVQLADEESFHCKSIIPKGKPRNKI